VAQVIKHKINSFSTLGWCI